MPSGKYDRTKYKRVCEYCSETFNFTTRGWKDHVSAHIRKGKQKSTALVSLVCPECKAEGHEITFRSGMVLNRHRSRVHKVRGKNYKFFKSKAKRNGLVVAHKGESTNGHTRINHQNEESQFQKIYAAGYIARSLEVLATGSDEPAGIFTSGVLAILSVRNHPMRQKRGHAG